MKKILIMRHAKSDWADSSLGDFERPLNERGKHDAPRMGKEIGKLNLVPDIIISSPAVRAAETARAVAKNCDFAGEIIFNDEFYHAHFEPIFKTLQNLPETCNTVMIFGHNPTWENLVLKLSGKYQTMSTASVAVLICKNNMWKELRFSECKLDFVLSPKEI
jgi:phosphohistidine phosphatase